VNGGKARGLTRRDFLVAANAACLLALIESCVPGTVARSGASPSVGGGTPYQRALLLLRDAVRASPDHLALRAADVVAGHDANKIVDFVRDRIAVVPPFWFLDDHRQATRWGQAATLRGGQGTLRERAEILADMLTRAGFNAQVMSADRPAAIGLTELYQQHMVQFSPDSKRVEAALAQLRQAGAPAPAAPQVFDPGPDPVLAILQTLPASLQNVRPRPDLLPPQVPVVAFHDGGKKRYAFALGNLRATDTEPVGLAGAASAETPPIVTVTVSAVANPAAGSKTPRGRQIDLVTGKWSADVIVGRQVLLTFVPPHGPKAYLESALSSLPMRVPVLRVQTDAPPVAAGAGLIATGPLITVHGDVMPTSSRGASPAPGTPIDGPFGKNQVLSDADRKQAVARVASVRVAANATAFPEIALELDITNSAGQSVDGFDARSLSIHENGKSVDGFTVLANMRSQLRPRVLVAYDTSGSVTQWWPTKSARATFEKNLGAALTAIDAQVPFEVQVVGTGTIPNPDAWASPQTAAIASALAAANVTDETWGTIAGPALDQGVVAIIMAGDVGDDTTAPRDIRALQTRLAGTRVPVLCVPLGPPAEAAVAKIVSVSHGARIDSNNLGRLAGLLQPLLAGWVGTAYRVRYLAPVGGPADRTVTVGLSDRTDLHGNATYRIPASPLAPPSFVSLHVTIEVGVHRSYRRLAGLQVNTRGFVFGDLDDPGAIAETRAALDGITTIAIEPGTPTSAAILDDVLSSCLSVEPLRPIWPTAGADQLLQAIPQGVRRTPGLFAALLAPARVDPGVVSGLRVAVLQERAPSATLIERHIDLAVGTNPVIAVTTDGHAGFAAAVATSVAASAAEAATFDDSAYSRLSGRPLTALPYGDFGAQNAFLKTVPPNKLEAWSTMASLYEDLHKLVPASGAGDAFWVVDPDTGAAKAMLLDSTGGAIIHDGCNFSATDQMAMTLSMLAVMCSYSPEVFPVVCLGINTAATAMTVAGLFDPASDANLGSPFSALLGAFNPLGVGNFTPQYGTLNAAIGLALILVTIQSSCS
jgi:hypothetical protein